MHRLKHVFWLFLLPFVLFACEEDNNSTQPAENLEISFSNLSDNEVISDSVTVSVDASPQESIRQLSLSFAGEKIDSLGSAPFQFGIDTRRVADGNYTLKATAQTEDGEIITEEISVEVSNPLAVIEIPTSGGDPGYEGYYYGIHQKDGSLIKGGAIALGQQIQVEAAQPYPSDTVMVSLYYETSDRLFIRSFTGAPRGSSWRMNFAQKPPQLADSLGLHINVQHQHGFYTSTSLSGSHSKKGDLYVHPAVEGGNQYFVAKYYLGGGMGDYEYGTVQDGDTVTVDFLNKSPTTQKITAPTEIGTNVSYSFAYNEDYRDALRLQTITGTSNPMEFSFPVDEFSNFVVVGDYSPFNGPEDLIHLTTIKHESSVPSKFAYSTGTSTSQSTGSLLSGTAELGDAQAVLYETSAGVNQTTFRWNISSDGDLPQMSLEAPEIVNQKFPTLSDLVWETPSSMVVRSDAIDSYQEFLDTQQSGIYAYPDYFVIPDDVYAGKSMIFNPLISEGSELVMKEFKQFN
jgi:hypothetical protein